MQYLHGPVRFNSALHGMFAAAHTLNVFCDVFLAPFESPREVIRISGPTAAMRSASLTTIACLRPQGVALSSTGSRSTKSGSELRERVWAGLIVACTYGVCGEEEEIMP